jgi:hypothetical protein
MATATQHQTVHRRLYLLLPVQICFPRLSFHACPCFVRSAEMLYSWKYCSVICCERKALFISWKDIVIYSHMPTSVSVATRYSPAHSIDSIKDYLSYSCYYYFISGRNLYGSPYCCFRCLSVKIWSIPRLPNAQESSQNRKEVVTGSHGFGWLHLHV